MSTTKHQKILKVGERVVAELAKGISRCTDAELRLLALLPNAASATNCWWLTYEIGRSLAKSAEYTLKSRTNARQIERQAKRA